MFWTGMRPSEVAGLTWGDIDLAHDCLHVRRSRHLFQYAAPKTRQTRRRVERSSCSRRWCECRARCSRLHVAPEAPVFKNTCGLPIGAEQLEAGGVQFPKSARRCDAQRVRKGGLEPPRVLPHRILNPARLPIPPLSHDRVARPRDRSRADLDSFRHRWGQGREGASCEARGIRVPTGTPRSPSHG